MELSSVAGSAARQNEGTKSLSAIWYALLNRWVVRLYFSRIKVIHPERLPQTGPVLYLGLHRNGAVDGFVYRRVLRRPTFLISTQLRKNWFARLFFHGIAVNRLKDEGNRSLNETALKQCLSHLQAGGELFIFPEGTSSLGPSHLPFKSGAIWLLLDYLRAGGPALQVIPLGIHYECPWGFRSRVEVVVGEPISTELPADHSQFEQLRGMKRRVQTALETVGINVCSAEHQEIIQRLAYAASLGTSRSYFKTLKSLEKSKTEAEFTAWNKLKPELTARKLLLHQGVPLFPSGSVALYVLGLLLASPIVSAAILLNLPPFLAGWFAGQRLADDRNVITLWRILVGFPIFVLWIGIVSLVAILFGQPLLLLGYVAFTWAGLKLYPLTKKLTVALHNQMRYPELRAPMLARHKSLLSSLPNEAE
ncbi:1-acyl-sn-glycerol-3-phosphate acyltransferase [Pedosphaera parvula]|uniref:Phospholipid/glycerol acyltransferase n=1 Tax=Pedosphaera parvula (strain Ellin514) TaxID=320771 RepID=B9XCQ9_PEDPL|nr:1-acyl-sn-glycerol-3-phosphate acyltransferase [Pedosphaera parvula]EEF62255.1 phospholipid/glycerol acyltransferase [Pedosphaera parvula Ellin514]